MSLLDLDVTPVDLIVAKISAPDCGGIVAAEKAKTRLEAVLQDKAALGKLYPLVLKYIAATGSAEPELPVKCTIVCCADHGVAEENVSAYPQQTTLEMTKNYLESKGSAANALSNFCSSELLVVDLGIAALKEPLKGLVDRRIAPGTQNFTKGPAMTRDQAIRSIEIGIELADTCIKNGCRCILPAEMGIANTTASAAISSVLCGVPPEEMTGRGTSISDERLRKKIAVVKRGIELNNPNPKDAIDVLAKVGGFEFGAIAGIILGAAANHAIVAIDGSNTAAAALIACSLCPDVTHYLIGSHLAAMPGHRRMLKSLGLEPYMDLKFRLGEATGSSIAVDLLDVAIRAYNSLTRPGQSKTTGGCFCVLPHLMMPDSAQVPLRLLDEYLKDFPTLNNSAMAGCQNRLNSLAKPIYSLGYLEQIAIEFAGIIEEKQPEAYPEMTLLTFSEEQPSGEYGQLLAAFASHADAKCMLALMRHDQPLTVAWNYGRERVEEIAVSDDVIGLSFHHADSHLLHSLLLNPNGSLKYAPDKYLEMLPPHLRSFAAAITGAITAAAKNRLFIVLDSEPVEIIARYTEALLPQVRPFILHVQPKLLQLDLTTDCGAVACLGFRLIDAALHILNDMKTFAESNVSLANDGENKERQG